MDIEKMQQEINLQINEEITVGNYRAYDFRIARYIGLEPAIILTYLCDQDKYINKRNVGQEFYKQQKYIEFFTGLTSKQQNLAVKKLKQLEIIEVVKKGMPARNHFKINYNKIREIKNKVLDDFYGEIERFDYYKHEFDTEQEMQENADKKAIENTNPSAAETSSLDLPKGLHINNKEVNNLNSSNNISKDIFILEVASQESTYIGAKNNNININNKKDVLSDCLVDGSASAPKEHAAPARTEKAATTKAQPKGRGGLGPLLNMVNEKYSKDQYPKVNQLLYTYLKAHIGIRRLPSIEKWESMLEKLYIYSSIKLVGTGGTKFVQNNAIKIVEKAINLKGNAPYPDFDNIYNIKLEESDVINTYSNQGTY